MARYILPPGGGRPKGSTNKLTASMRELLEEAIQQANADPARSLEFFSKKDPIKFWQMAARLIPVELNGTLEGGVTINVVTGITRASRDGSGAKIINQPAGRLIEHIEEEEPIDDGSDLC